jgi:hypothetical protein
MKNTKTIIFRGHGCEVLDERDGRLLIDGPRGQERVTRRHMTQLRVYTETNAEQIGQAIGTHVEYQGMVMVVAVVESMGESLTHATLEEVADADEVELPQAFERFMAAYGLRIASIEKWGYCYTPTRW